MKKIRTYITLALVLAGAFFAASGCTNPIMPRPAPQKAENAGDGAGIALIRFGGGARTVLPYAADFYYVLDFTPGAQTAGEAHTEYVSRSSSKSVGLVKGQWSLAVKGYIDADHAAAAPEEPGLTGSATFEVAAGEEVSVPIPLTAFQTYEGEGEFVYTVSFPAGVLSAELSLVNILFPGVGDQGPINLLTGASESEGVKTKTGSVTGVPAGFYRLVLDLSTTIAGDAAKALKTRVVRIQDSLLTKTQETFGPGDFYVGVLFDNLNDLKAYLDSRGTNTPDNPYKVGLSDQFDLASTALKEGTDNLGKLYAALTRYVELDLSACTGASTGATGAFSSGRTNQDKLVTLTLPPQIAIISSSTFTDCTNLRSVNLPEGLLTIQSFAFSGCTSLSSVTFPDSLTAIQQHAFQRSGLSGDIRLPSSVTSLGSYVFEETNIRSADLSAITLTPNVNSYLFQNCKNLKEVKLPATITQIDDYFFSGCESLDTLNWADFTTINLEVYSFRGTAFTSLPFEKFGTFTVSFAGMIHLVTVDMTSYTGGTTVLPGELFADCVNLESFTLAANTTGFTSLTSAGPFSNCPKICFYNTNGNSNFTVSADNGMLFNGDGTTLWAANSAGGQVTIPGGVTTLTASAFEGAPLTKVDMSGCTIASIPQAAFRNCAAFGELVFSASTTSIGIEAFKNTALTAVTLPSTLTTLYQGAFDGCAITAITLPASLTSLGAAAFVTDSLEKVTLPSNLGITLTRSSFPPRVVYEVTGTGGTYEVFESGKILVRNHTVIVANAALAGPVTLDNSVTAIGASAFDGCSGITAITLPSSLTSIGASAFKGCTALSSVSLPLLQSIGDSAFQNASALKWVKWPQSAANAYVGSGAFQNCTSLTHVQLPNNWTTGTMQVNCGIRSTIFTGTALQVLILEAATPPTFYANNANLNNAAYTFPKPDNGFTIYVPDAAVSAYQGATGWSTALIKSKINPRTSLPAQNDPSNWL